MLPLPPDVVKFGLICFALLGMFGFFYMRRNSFRSRLMYLILLFILITSVAFIWFAVSSVGVIPESSVYPVGKRVRFDLNTLGMPYYGGVFQYQSGPYPVQKRSGFTFYRQNLSEWEELKTDCLDCIFSDCEKGKLVERYYSKPVEQCRQVQPGPYFWNQTVFIPVQRICEGKPYTTYDISSAGAGKYRAEFCFGKAFNFDWDSPSCKPMQNVEPICLETEFWIK